MNYEETIRTNAEGKLAVDIPNSTCEHAAIGISYLLANATGKVRLLTTEFYREFWKNFEEKIKVFLAKNPENTFEVLLIEKKEESLDLLRSLAKEAPGKFSIRHLDENNLQKNFPSIPKNTIPNFMVIDPVGYRYEISDVKRRDSIVSGLLNYGNVAVSEKLKRSFDCIYQNASSQAL